MVLEYQTFRWLYSALRNVRVIQDYTMKGGESEFDAPNISNFPMMYRNVTSLIHFV